MSFKESSLEDPSINSKDKSVEETLPTRISFGNSSGGATVQDKSSLFKENLPVITTLSSSIITPSTTVTTFTSNYTTPSPVEITFGNPVRGATVQNKSSYGEKSRGTTTLSSSIITPYTTTTSYAFNFASSNNSYLCGTTVHSPSLSSSVASSFPLSKLFLPDAVIHVQKDFIKLLISEEDSDITIKVQGKEIRAHKAILRARSPVFKTMLSHEMIEKTSGSVTIDDFDICTLKNFLHFLYSGDTSCINEKNVCNLYKASDKYDVEELKKACSIFMKNNLSIKLFCDVMSIALLHNEENLTDAAIRFFCHNAEAIVQTPYWISFLSSNLIAGNELFLKALSANRKVIQRNK